VKPSPYLALILYKTSFTVQYVQQKTAVSRRYEERKI
jgi:hypothetical protein